MDHTSSPSRRAFIASTVGVGAAGLGVESMSGKVWAGHSTTADTSGTVETVVRFEPADGGGKRGLQRHARTTQQPFEQFAAKQSDISIERQFWAANAALVSVDFERVSREMILGVDGVIGMHPNYAGRVHSAAEGTAEAASIETEQNQTEQSDVTYPLAEMDVPRAWEVYGTRGEGVDVAVIDSGIDTSGHEELAASLERGGWAGFDENGNRLDTEPSESGPVAGHGTAVSGVIAGGTNDDGDRYGIAPEVNLYVAKQVSKLPEGLRLLSVFAGIEWAIEQDVDVLTMSLGLPQYNQAFVEPVRNAIESGIFVVSSTGNAGPYTSVSPANIPGVLSAGGIDDDRALYSNSSGERVDTDRYWEGDAAEGWPEEYVVPDVSAPAVNIPSAAPNGEFVANRSGTSYAAPCIAAVAALAIGATDADNEAIRNAIIETARHPAADDDFDIDPGHDHRYGQGIVSALAAISLLRASEPISGTVTDESGTPLDGVTVGSETSLTTRTDSQGTYELTLPPISQPVGAIGLGFDRARTRLNPADTETQSFELARTDSLDIEMTERMPTRVDPGEAVTATFDAANAETITVQLGERGPFEPGLELTVNGTPAAFGEPVTVDPDRTQLTVSVAVPGDAFVARFRPRYEITGGDSSVSGRGHLVHAHPDPWLISPSDPPDLQTPVDLMAPRTTLELTGGQGKAVAGAEDDAGIVIDKPLTLTAADGATPRIQFSNESDGNSPIALVTANDVTISGLVIEGEGAGTGVQVARDRAVPRVVPQPSGVTVSDLAISGVDTAIHAGHAPSLRIVNNELTANATGISVGRRVEFRESVTVTGRTKTTIRENTVTDAETGIDVAGQVAGIEGNTLSNIGGTGIVVGTPRFLSKHWGQEIGPVRSNTVTGANRGIVIDGVVTLPVEGNELSDITETALVVNGGVLAPIQSNRVDTARTGLVIAEGAEVASLADNEFTNIEEPGDDRRADDSDGSEQTDGTVTDDRTPSVADTESASNDTTSPSADTSDSGSGASGPGFGVGSTLAALGGAGYFLKHWLSDDSTNRGS